MSKLNTTVVGLSKIEVVLDIFIGIPVAMNDVWFFYTVHS